VQTELILESSQEITTSNKAASDQHSLLLSTLLQQHDSIKNIEKQVSDEKRVDEKYKDDIKQALGDVKTSVKAIEDSSSSTHQAVISLRTIGGQILQM
jgi:hypothetical protein